MRYKHLILLIFLSLQGYVSLYGQISCPPNIDFELGTTADWHYYRGTVATGPIYSLASSPATPGWHTLTSGSLLDPYGGFPVVGSGSYSLKLGHDTLNYCAERARYYIHVPSGPASYSLIYRYAVVFQDPGSSHSVAQKPRFEVNAYDSATSSPIPCAQYTYIAGSGLPGFTASTLDPSALYKTWAIASMDLSSRGGTTITMDFTAADCTQGGHWGYGYLDMSCGLFAISSVICGSPTVTLTAPIGFGVYAWYDSLTFSTSYGSTQTISFPVPAAPTTIAVILQPYAGFGCPDTLYTRVIPSNLSIHGSNDTVICSGNSVTLSTGATSIALPLHYNWTPSTGLSCSTCASPIATPTVSTSYMVTVTDGAGCTKLDTIRVSVNPPPAVAAGPPTTMCSGYGATLFASGAVSYSWLPGAALSCTNCPNPVANPATTTIYTLTGTDANGCTNTDTQRVTVISALHISVPNISICYGITGTLAATGGAATYSWYPSTGLSCSGCPNPTANPITTTTYTVIGVNSACLDTTTVTVTVNPLPTISAGPTAQMCAGSYVTLIGSGGVSYIWSPGAGLSCTLCSVTVASPATTTVYTVTGTDVNGCRSSSPIAVVVHPLPIISAGVPVSLCYGTTTTLAPFGGFTYVWTPGTGLSCSSCTNPVADPLITTVYSVIGTDANGCTGHDTVRITRFPPVTVSAANITICNGTPGSLTAVGATTYTWAPGTGLSCTSCSSPSASPSATTVYTVIGTVGLCQDTTTVTVTVHPVPLITVTGGTSKCAGDPCILTATGGVTYSWTPALGLSCTNCASPIATPGITTTYTALATNSFGCTATGSTTVTVHPLPDIVVPNAAICFGTSASLLASGASSYKWSPATGLNTNTGATVVASPSVTTTYKIVGTDAFSCKDSINEVVTVIPIPPAPTVVNPVQYCRNAPSLPLSATGTGLLWYTTATGGTGSATVPVPSTAEVGATTWYVSQTVDGCESPRVPISVIITTNAVTGFDYEIHYGCYTDTVMFRNNSQYVKGYVWSFGDNVRDTTANSVHYYPAVQTEWDILVSLYGASFDCYDDSTLKTIPLMPSPPAKFLINVTPDQTIPYGSSVQLHAEGAMIYTWKPDNGSLSNANVFDPVATPLEQTTYIVYGRNAEGCLDSADVDILFTFGDDIVIPDAFSPNGDGRNDVFKIINIHSGKLRDFKIFNRWGQLVFETTDIKVGWDGNFNGIPQDMDVFMYLAIVEHVDHTTKMYKGDLTLVR